MLLNSFSTYLNTIIIITISIIRNNKPASIYPIISKLENGNYYVPGFEMSKKFIESINKFSMYQNCANIKNETIIIQGTKDLSVLPEFSYKYSQEIKGSVLHYIDGAGHGYDSYEQREELYSLTIEFINRK